MMGGAGPLEERGKPPEGRTKYRQCVAWGGLGSLRVAGVELQAVAGEQLARKHLAGENIK